MKLSKTPYRLYTHKIATIKLYYYNCNSLSFGNGSKYLSIIESFTSSKEDGDHFGFLSLSINNARTPFKHKTIIYVNKL